MSVNNFNNMESYNKAWRTIVQPPQCSYDDSKDLPVEFVAKKEMIKRHSILDLCDWCFLQCWHQ